MNLFIWSICGCNICYNGKYANTIVLTKKILEQNKIYTQTNLHVINVIYQLYQSYLIYKILV